VTVTAAAGCNWNASSNAPWITISGGSSGTGSGAVSYNVAANTNASSRTGTLTVAGHTFTIDQAGLSCNPTISPTSFNGSAAGGSGNVVVTAATGCSWNATSNASWITITAGSSGSGGGSVTYSFPANPDTTARAGTITIAGATFTLNQAAAPCSPTISPASASAAASGITATVSVTAANGCSWTATSNAPWISIGGGASGNGNGLVTYTVAAYTGSTSRTGTLTIGGNTFTVTQASAGCSYTISPTGLSMTATGGIANITVTTPTGCSWTATSNTSWITVTSGASGSGFGIARYSAAANTTGTARTGTLTVAGHTYTVTQPSNSCTFTVNPRLVTVLPTGGSGTISVSTQPGCDWTSSVTQPWVTLSATGTGTGQGTYTVPANTGTVTRSATIHVAGVSISLTQNAPAPQTTGAPSNLRIIKDQK
jgi:hypothetical protein